MAWQEVERDHYLQRDCELAVTTLDGQRYLRIGQGEAVEILRERDR